MFSATSAAYAPLAGASVLYADPIAMAILDGNGAAQGVAGLGVFSGGVNGLGFTVPVIGINTDDLPKLAQAFQSIQHLFGGGGGSNPKAMALVHTIPFSLLRLQGGHGKWTDTLTGEVLTDLGSEVRKGAIITSALGMYNDKRNWWFDDLTGQHVEPDTALLRWTKLFGNADFPAAYAQYPQLFRVFGSNPANDPVIPDIGGTPLPPEQSTAQTFAGLLGTLGGAPSTPSLPHGTPATTTRPGGGSLLSAGVGGVSPVILLAVAGAALFLIMGRKK